MVREIKIKDKTYPIKVKFYAEMQLVKEFGFRILELDENNVLKIEKHPEAWATVFYYAVESGCKETGQDFDLKKEDIPFILDDVFEDFMKILPSFFSKQTDETDKKK